MNHTPGPWKQLGGIVRDSEGSTIADVIGSNFDDPIGISNARLIAAAPDLLELVSDLLKSYGPSMSSIRIGSDRRVLWIRARDVLDKLQQP